MNGGGERPLGELSDAKILRSLPGLAASGDSACSNTSSTLKTVPFPSSVFT